MSVCEHCGRLVPHGCAGGDFCRTRVAPNVMRRPADALALLDHDDAFAELGTLPPEGGGDE